MSDGNRRLRVLALAVAVPLLGAAVLWWIAGTDMTRARLISIVVIVVSLGGWYLTRRNEPDE